MENCLVSKLKGSVNPDLPRFDGVRIKVAAGQTSPIQIARIAVGEKVYGTRLLAVSNCSFSVEDAVTHEVITGTDVSTISEHNLIINVLITDTTREAEYVIFGFNSIKGMGAHDSLDRNKFGIVDYVNYKLMPNLADINFYAVLATTVIDLDDFINNALLTPANLKYINMRRASSSDYRTTGHLSALNGCIALKELNLAYSSISGEIKDFARALEANGATSGTLAISVIGSEVTFGGASVASMEGWYRITWDDNDVYMTQI